MNVYESIMRGLNEVLEYAEGEGELRTNKLSIVPLCEYQPVEIKNIRLGTKMTQVKFADFMGVSLKTIEAWEAGRNRPNGPARRILSMVQQDPNLPERYNIVGR